MNWTTAIRHPLIATGLDYIARHPIQAASNPRTAWATRKAMNAYRKEHPVCEWDGKTTPVEVHHKKPIDHHPELAADPANFISLGARRNHLVIGHAGNWHQAVEDLDEICRLRRIIQPPQK